MKLIILIITFILLQTAVWAQTIPIASNDQAKSPTAQNDQKELVIFPNPVKNGKVNLQMNTDEIVEINLVNITGKEVLNKKLPFGTSSYELKLENVPNGLYLIQVKTAQNKAVVKKLLVSGN